MLLNSHHVTLLLLSERTLQADVIDFVKKRKEIWHNFGKCSAVCECVGVCVLCVCVCVCECVCVRVCVCLCV